MSKTRLTDLLIKSAKPDDGKTQADFWDASVTGLSMRVTNTGTKTFSFKFRNQHGVEQRVKLGRYPELTLAAARAAAMVAKSRVLRCEPAVEKPNKKEGGLTSSALVAEFVKRHAKFNKTGGQTERILKTEFLAKYGKRDYRSITKTEIIRIIETIADRGAPSQARNALAALRKMFNWAVSRDLLEHSPCDRVKAPGKPAKRDKVLTLAEIQSVWAATEKLNWPFREITQLLILTGQRRSEIANLRWSWIDDESRAIIYPAEAMKNSREHVLPLSHAAWDLLQRVPHFAEEDRLFPSRRIKSDKTASGFSKAKRTLDSEVGKHDWVYHDLRRTVATQMNAIGIRDTTVDRVLSHVIPGVSGIYNKHQYFEEKREALEKWAARLMGK